jgi:hypothetical protein
LAGVTDHLELLIDKIETSTPNPRQRGTIAVDGSRQFNR